jgi:hypothetical protein
MAVLNDNEYSNRLFLKTRTENTLVEVEVELRYFGHLLRVNRYTGFELTIFENDNLHFIRCIWLSYVYLTYGRNKGK